MLGYAWQQGRVPLSHAALMRAIELNGVQVDNNKAAFEWGRRCAHDLAAVQSLFKAGAGDRVRQEAVARRARSPSASTSSPATRTRPTPPPTRPSSTRCAGRGAAAATTHADRGGGALPVQADGLQGRVRGRAAAHRPGFRRARSTAMFEGDYKLVHHLAPPLIAKNNDKGELIKQPFGPWMRTAFALLAKLKGLRGTRARPVRPQRRAPHRARADRRVPRLHRRAARHAERRQPAAGRRDRAHPRRDPRLRPCQGSATWPRRARSGTR